MSSTSVMINQTDMPNSNRRARKFARSATSAKSILFVLADVIQEQWVLVVPSNLANKAHMHGDVHLFLTDSFVGTVQHPFSY